MIGRPKLVIFDRKENNRSVPRSTNAWVESKLKWWMSTNSQRPKKIIDMQRTRKMPELVVRLMLMSRRRWITSSILWETVHGSRYCLSSHILTIPRFMASVSRLRGRPALRTSSKENPSTRGRAKYLGILKTSWCPLEKAAIPKIAGEDPLDTVSKSKTLTTRRMRSEQESSASSCR